MDDNYENYILKMDIDENIWLESLVKNAEVNKNSLGEQRKKSILIKLEKMERKQTLSDWLPHEFKYEFSDTKAFKFKDVEVVKCHGHGEKDHLPWIGNHKHVLNWCELSNGYAVGWNENPSVGWAFPVKKMMSGL